MDENGSKALRGLGFAPSRGGALVRRGPVGDRSVQALLDRLAEGEPPSADRLAEAPKLEGWAWAVAGGHVVLVGTVTGHPILGEGRLIATSALLAVCADGRWARTISRWYRLGAAMG